MIPNMLRFVFKRYLVLLTYWLTAPRTWRIQEALDLKRLLGGGALNFVSGRDVRPGFPKCGACELIFAFEKGGCELKISKFGGMWTENFKIWGLVSWKCPNLGACELKFGWKLRLQRLKFPNFLKRGSCELTLLLEMGPLRTTGEAWKGGLQGCTSPYPLSRSVPPGGCYLRLNGIHIKTSNMLQGS